jgi:capsid protein
MKSVLATLIRSDMSRMILNSTKRVAEKTQSNAAWKVYHTVKNWYEAGYPTMGGGGTSYLPELYPQDSRWDQNSVTRREMMRRMRYWAKNSAITEAILSIGERYTVGASGLHVSFYPSGDLEDDSADNSLEKTWYDNADDVISEWFHDCGWNDETMAELLKICFRNQKVDGDCFVVKTRKAGAVSLRGRTIQVLKPALQIVEAHRVLSDWGSNAIAVNNDLVVDGVQYKKVMVDGIGMMQKAGFWMHGNTTAYGAPGTGRLVPADQCWQLRNVHRADQPRSVSDFYACEVLLNKLEDMLEIETKAHSAQSIRAVGLKSNSGLAASPLDSRLDAIRRAQGNKPPAKGSDDFEKRRELYRRETGAYIYGYKDGEEIKFDSPNRPSESTQQLWDYIVNSICAATHNPRCLVFQKISGSSGRSQGTEVRAELDAADTFYKGDFQKWKNFVCESVIWFMEWAIKNDSRVADPPADWKSCIHIQQPEACNVDVGYTTQADMMQLAAGAASYQMLLGRQGLSAITVFKQLAREQKFMKKLGVQVTLPALLAGQIQLNAPKPEEKEPVTT